MTEPMTLRQRAAQVTMTTELRDGLPSARGDAAASWAAAHQRRSARLKRKTRYGGDDTADAFRHQVTEGRLAITSSTGQVRVNGIASRTGVGYQMWDMFGPYTEIVRSGAFKSTLAADPMVVFVGNHSGFPMATTKNGDLTLAETDEGLTYEATMPLADPDVYALAHKIARGTVTENSMMFYLVEARWSEDYTTRTIVEVDLDRGDVGPVMYGANPHTPLGIQKVKKDEPADEGLASDPPDVIEAAARRGEARGDARVDTDRPTVTGERSHHDRLAVARRRASAESLT